MLRYARQRLIDRCLLAHRLKNGSWLAVTRNDGILHCSREELFGVLRTDARKGPGGGQWKTINGAHVFVKNGIIVTGGGGNIPTKGAASPQGANSIPRRFIGKVVNKKTPEQVHYEKHGVEMGYKSIREYMDAGIKFVEQPCGGKVVGYVRNDQLTVVRYNKETNELATGNVGKRGGLITYFKPEEGRVYYERQKKKDSRNLTHEGAVGNKKYNGVK